MHRRTLLSLVAAAALAPAAFAQSTWPSQPIRLIVPYPAGGGTDFFARLVAPGMGEALGQPVIVENRPGASGIIGATAVAKQLPADGHTFLLGDMTTYAVNPSMFEKLSYDPLKDLVPVTMTAKFDFVLVVNPTVLPVGNVQELIALAARTPAGLSYASPSVGTTHHLATELLARETGMKLVAITYKGGGPAVQDLLGGQVGMMFLDRASARPHIESGKLRPIAAAGSKRIAAYPEVPTLAEQGVKGFEVEGWQGFSVRAGTPEPVIRALNAAYLKAIAPAEVKRKLNEAGIDPVGGTPEQFTAYIQAETVKWRSVVRERNIKAE
ncbi:tripartite tricarboxylate transporter substrate binding protein [Variovorax soli]|uniref:Tripartite-type tricarboxylate transporter receptor subunit TctC n=1 Tax=Variovorax soli TaxID=376815 RepID=A0ABU1NJ74_9BURK|nr:tripartite tricarboxylate transporter substrate binding protein [Variovorax soli]MDR6538503.1 tripartite-type tricarboxylate transporter receptor subunit TctC [Variovorax soli]